MEEETTDANSGQSRMSEQVERLLACMGDQDYSTRELMELLNLKHRPTFRNNYLGPALEMDLVEMTIPETPNSRNQKYRKVKVSF